MEAHIESGADVELSTFETDLQTSGYRIADVVVSIALIAKFNDVVMHGAKLGG